MLSYKKLFKSMIDKDLKRKDVARMSSVAPSTIGRMANGEPVNLSVIEKICLALELRIEDVVEILPDEIPSANDQTSEKIG